MIIQRENYVSKTFQTPVIRKGVKVDRYSKFKDTNVA